MLIIFWLFIVGAVVGSFLNVCIYRLPRSESVVFPPSHCPSCAHQLNFWDLIPVLSYFWLRGHCRYCQQPINGRYPLVELITGLLFSLLAWRFLDQPLVMMGGLLLASLSIVCFFVDLEKMVIPDAISLTGIIGGISFNGLRAFVEKSPNWFFAAIIGLLVGAGTLYLIGLLGKLVFKKEAMGDGDYYLGAMFGAFLGWQGVLVMIFLAYLLAGVMVLILLSIGKVKMGGYIPFGPALVAGGIIAFLYGQQLLAWYLAILVGG